MASMAPRRILEPMPRPSRKPAPPVAALALCALAAAALAAAQVSYEDAYGKPVDVSVTDLVQNPDPYFNRSVRTRGRLELEQGLNGPPSLRDTFGARIYIQPYPAIAGEWEQASMKMMGQDVQVTGLLQEMN